MRDACHGRVTVGLHDEPAVRPEKVDEDAVAAGKGDAGLGHRPVETRPLAEQENPPFQVFPGARLFVFGEDRSEDPGAAPPVRPGEDVVKRVPVEEAQALGTFDRSLELRWREHVRKVEQGARDRRAGMLRTAVTSVGWRVREQCACMSAR